MRGILSNIEILTEDGFKVVSDLKINENIFSYDGNNMEYTKISKIQEYAYDGNVNVFEGRGYKQSNLPYNDMFYLKPNTSVYDLRKSESLKNHSKLSLPITTFNYYVERYNISDEMLKLFVIILTDGTVKKIKDRPIEQSTISIYKSKIRWGFKEIPEILDNLKIKYNIVENTTNSFGEMIRINIMAEDSHKILSNMDYTKKKLPSFFKLLNREQSKLVIDTWSLLDGSKSDRSNFLCQCDNDDIFNELQLVAIKAGYGSTKTYRKCKKFGTNENTKILYLNIYGRVTRRISKYDTISGIFNIRDIKLSNGCTMVIAREDNKIPYILSLE